MKERAITFGSHGGLVGIVTEPDERAGTERRAVIMSNVGMHHRVGPFRLYVELARHLAAQGWYVLRFDLSGLGDSEVRRGTQSDAERATLDFTEAIDWMQERLDIRHVVLLGLCSGVDSTHAVTVADPRVNGAVFIDGYTYPTTGFLLRRHLGRLLQTGRWARYAQRKLSAARTGSPHVGQQEPEETVFTRDYPLIERFRDEIRAVAARGTKIFFIFTGSVDYRYNSKAQLFEQLGERPGNDAIEVGYFKEIDHLFSSETNRQKLFAAMDGWLSRSGQASLPVSER